MCQLPLATFTLPATDSFIDPRTKDQDIFFFFFKRRFNLFIYFWLHWVFVAECGLSLVVASGGYSSLRCVGFSLRWLLSVAEHGL